MQQTLGQLQHKGVWKSLKWIKQHGRKVGENELTTVMQIDLQEGKPVILGNTIWAVFLHDRIRQRYFLEKVYEAHTQEELFNAFAVLMEEWI